MSNRYWITYNDVGVNPFHPGGLINIHINKNPGSYSNDPHYPILEPYQCIRSFWNLITEMPKADIEIKE